MAKPIDGLLAVADDEDRRWRVRRAFAFAPGVDQQLDELPLEPAGVLELVDEHVVVARLELQPAPRELLLPAEQLAQFRMFHARPVLIEYIDDGNWRHIGGDWKLRNAANGLD